MGYGHWLPNDIRGSWSSEIRNKLLEDLGEIHWGRKQIQPPRNDLKQFFRDAKSKLELEVLWFDETVRSIIGDCFGKSIQNFGYQCYACAVLKNHAHLVIARHKHNHEVMWNTLAEGAKVGISRFVPEGHRVWGERPYSKFLYSPEEIESAVDYVKDNPVKEGLPEQKWEFVLDYRRR